MKLALVNALSILLYPGNTAVKITYRGAVTTQTLLFCAWMLIDLHILHIIYTAEAPFVPQYEWNCSMILVRNNMT